MATPAKRRGQPPKDDRKALDAIRKAMRGKKNLSYFKAAFNYAVAHPESGVAPESIARRLTDKLKAEEGVPKRLTDASLRADLEQLKQAVLRVAQLVDAVLSRVPKKPSK